VEATQTVLAAARASGVKRIIHMSALGARAGARSRYHQTKWTAEELVRGCGLNWTIFRPSVIYGREDGFVNLLAKICRWSPVIPVFGPGTNQLQPVAVEDVAHCFVEALSKRETLGQTMDLCGTERLSMDELCRVILQVTRRRRPLIHIPMLVGRLQAALMEVCFGVLGMASPLTRDQLLMLEEDNVGEPAEVMRLFGFAPEKFATGIAKYVR
jgi:NADH dehydrogenase